MGKTKSLSSSNKPDLCEIRKSKHGQFLTPDPIARFMSDWILAHSGCKAILDPAVGTGVLLRAIMESTNAVDTIIAYDIDSHLLQLCRESFARNNIRPHLDLLNNDYMMSGWGRKYDGIICNPPYFRFQDYENKDTIIERVKSHLKVHLSGLTNLCSLFLIKSMSELNQGGRMAYVIPSEFLNSNYGEYVKHLIVQNKSLRYVILFDFNSSVFEDAITTSSILLFSQNNRSQSVEFISIKEIDELEELAQMLQRYPATARLGNSVPFSDLQPEKKWRRYYQTPNATKYKNLIPLNNIGRVSRGISTGSNDFFTFNSEKIANHNIPDKCLLPCITKSPHAKSLFFTNNEFEQLKEDNRRVFLFNAAQSQDQHVKQYISYGEEIGIHKKYLTRHRTPWYALENRPPAPIWVGVFNRNGVKVVRNEAAIRNLTTFYCLYLNFFCQDKVDLVFAYLISNVALEIF